MGVASAHRYTATSACVVKIASSRAGLGLVGAQQGGQRLVRTLEVPAILTQSHYNLAQCVSVPLNNRPRAKLGGVFSLCRTYQTLHDP